MGCAYQIRYELKNHLGNVLSVISDKKLAVEDPNSPPAGASIYSCPLQLIFARSKNSNF